MMALAELRLIFLETLQLAVIHHDAVLKTVILLLHRRVQRCKLLLMLERILQASWKRPPGWESPGPQSPRHQEGRFGSAHLPSRSCQGQGLRRQPKQPGARPRRTATRQRVLLARLA